MIEEMVNYVTQGGLYVLAFLFVLSIVVFVHEFGHFWIARRCGVKIETFSIGFGPEIFGWMDRHGTCWRVAWIPMGGYVKMFGDADPASVGVSEDAKELSEEEKKIAFYTQGVSKRFAIVAAGPGFNYLFAVILLAILFTVNGQPYTPAVVGQVIEESAAERAGFEVGDQIMAVDGTNIRSFEALQRIITINAGTQVKISLNRGGTAMTIEVTPDVVRLTDRLGMEHNRGRLGVVSEGSAYRELTFFAAVRESLFETWNITATTLQGVGQMIMGMRGTEELGGPLRIAEMSGKVAREGGYALLWFIIVISINLGLINLFPIPLLDGGHLLFYLVEGIRGRPVSERVQEYGARAGLVVVLSLMLFATWNDLVHLRVVSFIRGLFS
ncbi:MAG: RIP metalloprotease RseP [Alphaproteobacteria bacterium]|nr:RIP metalloprotease RseP [Alphaproteobacteria bacterium]